MPGKTRPRRSSEIQPHIKTIGPEGLSQDLHHTSCLAHHLMKLGFGEIIHSGHMPIGGDQNMPVVIRVQVEHNESQWQAPEDEMLSVPTGPGEPAKDSSPGFRPVKETGTPGRPEPLHTG